jgi:hypothetical protein
MASPKTPELSSWTTRALARQARAVIRIVIVEVNHTAARQVRHQPLDDRSRRAVVIAVDPYEDRECLVQGGEQLIRQRFLKKTPVQPVVPIARPAVGFEFPVPAAVLALHPVITRDDVLIHAALRRRQAVERIETVDDDYLLHSQIAGAVQHFRVRVSVGRAELKDREGTAIVAPDLTDYLVDMVHPVKGAKQQSQEPPRGGYGAQIERGLQVVTRQESADQAQTGDENWTCPA